MTETETPFPQTLDEIKGGLGPYLSVFGATLGRKANGTITPLHVPGKDPLPDFSSAYGRQPYPAQAHVATANAKLLATGQSGVIVGECGTGKTIVSILALDHSARLSRRMGGKSGNYNAIVICPDHLISKWKREIELTIPNANVRTFENWKEFLTLRDEFNVIKRLPGGNEYEVRHGARWAKPRGANWFVVGRNQIKWYTEKEALGEERMQFGGKKHKNQPAHHFLVGSKEVKDEAGNTVYGKDSYSPKMKNIYQALGVCPKCGMQLLDERGAPLSWATLHHKKARLYVCKQKYLQEIVAPARSGESGVDVIHPDRHFLAEAKKPSMDKLKVGSEVKLGGKTYLVRECGEPLWQYGKRPWRWSMAWIMQRKMRGFFDYLIVDECFPGDTPISTPDGDIRIDEIVPGQDVYSWDGYSVVRRKVTRAIRKRRKGCLMEIRHPEGSVKCTPSHEFFVVTGVPTMKPAISLRRGDYIVIINKEAFSDGSETVRPMHGELHMQAEHEASVLLEEVRDHVSLAESGESDQDASRGSGAVGVEQTGLRGSHEENEPGQGVQGEVGCRQEEQGLRRREGRQWSAYEAAKASGGRHRVQNGVSSQDGQPVVAVCLDGPGESGPEDRDRSRRSHAQATGPANERSDQGENDREEGLEDTAVHERGHRRRHLRRPGRYQEVRVVQITDISFDSPGDCEFVYDIEVDDTHNYFAGGILVSNCHEMKNPLAIQSVAFSKVNGITPRMLALTGTFINGYAPSLFNLLMRMSPRNLIERGFEWGDENEAFAIEYGRRDRIVSCKAPLETYSKKGTGIKAVDGKPNVSHKVAPGIMPTLFGHMVMPVSTFITLEEMADELPDLVEVLDEGCVDMDDDVKAEYERIEHALATEVRKLAGKGSMKLCGSMLQTLLSYPDHPWEWYPKFAESSDAPPLLGQSFLKHFRHEFDPKTDSLLLRPIDSPDAEPDRVPMVKKNGVYWIDVAFDDKSRDKKSFVYDTGASCVSVSYALAVDIGLNPEKGREGACQIADGSTVKTRETTLPLIKVGKSVARNVDCSIICFAGLHAVGFWEKPVTDHPELMKRDNWHGVVTPYNFDFTGRVLPKDQRLLEIVQRHVAKGEQCWVYVQMTKKRNVMPRLQKLLEDNGIRCGVLNDYDAEPTEREEWIRANGDKFDCVLSYPRLVSTGLDLFWKEDELYKFNYNALVFYQTGYNLFDLRQASRRAWRLGQDRDCVVYYLYYRGTMQHRAMELMSRKLEAALQIEGEFSEDGLAALSSDSSAQMELVKRMSGSIDDKDISRSWTKIKAGGKKKARTENEPEEETPFPQLQLEDQRQDEGDDWLDLGDHFHLVPPGQFVLSHSRHGAYLCEIVHTNLAPYLSATAMDWVEGSPKVANLTPHDVARDRWRLIVDALDTDSLMSVVDRLRTAGFVFGADGTAEEVRRVSTRQYVVGEVEFETGIAKPETKSHLDAMEDGPRLVAETVEAHGGTPDEIDALFDEPDEEDEFASLFEDGDDFCDWFDEPEESASRECPKCGNNLDYPVKKRKGVTAPCHALGPESQEKTQVVELGNGSRVGFVGTDERANQIEGQFSDGPAEADEFASLFEDDTGTSDWFDE